MNSRKFSRNHGLIMAWAIALPLFLVPISSWAVEYRYDVLNRLVAVHHASGQSVRYVYDSVGNRSRKLAFVDTDADLLPDNWELTELGGLSSGADDDNDGDSLRNLAEFDAGTRPGLVDSDGDGLSDGTEISVYGTLPTVADTDGDGVPDGTEIDFGTDPLDPSDAPTLPLTRWVAFIAAFLLLALGLYHTRRLKCTQ